MIPPWRCPRCGGQPYTEPAGLDPRIPPSVWCLACGELIAELDRSHRAPRTDHPAGEPLRLPRRLNRPLNATPEG